MFASREDPAFVILCALPPEALAVAAGLRARSRRRGIRRGRVALVGMGPKRARQAASRHASTLPDGLPVVVMGVGGALVEGFTPGDLVVANALGRADVGSDGSLEVSRPPVAFDESSADLGARLAESLGEDFEGAVRLAPVMSALRTARAEEREKLGKSGAVVCDTESFYLARLAERRPFAVVRSIVDTPERELKSAQTVSGGVTALKRLGQAVGVVADVASGFESR